MSKSVEQKLKEVYREIPEGFCKGLCSQTCGPVSMTSAEMDRCKSAAEPKYAEDDHLRCPFLSAEGRCRVYSVRPLVCRALGASPALPCPHGCKPKKLVSLRTLRKLFAKVESFGGESVSTHPEIRSKLDSVYPLLLQAGLSRKQAMEVASWAGHSHLPAEELVKTLKQALSTGPLA